MALPSTGAMSFSAIQVEYERTQANFNMSQCWALNSGLGVGSATAQISASDFRNARYGIDTRTVTTKGTQPFGDFDWYGYDFSEGYGTINTRSIMEQSNQMLVISSLSNGTTYFKAVNATYARIHAFFIDGSADLWPSKIYDSGNDQYYWNTQYWTSTSGTGAVHIWYNQ